MVTMRRYLMGGSGDDSLMAARHDTLVLATAMTCRGRGATTALAAAARRLYADGRDGKTLVGGTGTIPASVVLK